MRNNNNNANTTIFEYVPAEGGVERLAASFAGLFARDFASLFNNY